MSLDSAEATFINEWVEAMEAGANGDKQAVAVLQAKALIKLVKAGDINTVIRITNTLGLMASTYPVAGTVQNAGSGEGSMS
jgi:hypothetical protein